MSNSITFLSRRLYRPLLSIPRTPFHLSQHFCTNHPSSDHQDDLNLEELPPDSDIDAPSTPSSSPDSSSPDSNKQRVVFDRLLENGLDAGIYKAILVGMVGQPPLQKRLRSGTVVTQLSMGTGGIRNNRRPLDNEDPREYANKCSVQWHRVSIYPQRLGDIVMKHVVPRSILYVEGNLETKVFTDPITGLVRRIREIAIRRNGRLVFLGQGDAGEETQNQAKNVGYY
ncbi:single-stranded DNA-binding protein, mitochondrial [Neltuma alba]|uniref:single-stranded DNA-binding protein, mitochondrial n=1 Tax=Neltuma alba TaxID=207710 RepID=UPI0010A47D56|nr:single-stranded DNA-binding protein, mitochondrial [Prosopis alba]